MTSLMVSPGHKVAHFWKIDAFPSIFQLQRRSKAQNIGNTHGYLAGIFDFRYNIWYKRLSQPENGGHFEKFEI